ncbi:hypothetical protein CONLIGDRAFT_657717 [Coniochaeta ligniaria NRRL 30616]|uniref:Ornithine decarboxylase antizyme n=1 Tax=Coniochaeta ligniaria NRRL 30616 TaxID=1408157 RepID=A0A1J7IR06_9PEZI|nr:hypothetical protein CONLIGDRAFT_657717 [Coniochaeta ligniaria NRRL 30616]
MAPMKHNSNNHSSSNYGEGIVRQANILASCYVVPSTGLPSPPSSPPLAAITATNELALTPKEAKSARHNSSGRSGSINTTTRLHRRGGATSRIRGECERFFCETLRATFLGEMDGAARVSRLTDVYYHHDQQHSDNHNHNYYNGSGGVGLDGANDAGRAVVDAHGQLTPPDYFPIGDHAAMAAARNAAEKRTSGSVGAWLEIWDYAGGNSFRAFVAEDDREVRSLFVFFDANVLGRELKDALVALIELAEGPLACSHMVVCVDREMAGEEGKPLLTGLQWAGFSLTTLDFWTGGVDVTSGRWLFMGMEVV